MIFFNDSAKNAYLFRRVTSSIIASVFALSFGVCSVKPTKAEETKRFKFCDDNKSLFHLNSGNVAKRKVRIAIFDVESSPSGETAEEGAYQFKGHSDILASKLIKNNNFAVISWTHIKPSFLNQSNSNKQEAEDLFTLENLRDIRTRHGVEAVFVGTLNQFNVNGNRTRQFLGFGKKTNRNEVYLKLNFRVINTSTGEIIFAAEGNSHNSKSYTSEVNIPKVSVEIIKGNTNKFNDDNRKSNLWDNTKEDSITLTIKLGDATETIVKSESENTSNKLIAMATEDVINQIADKLNSHSDKLACLLRKPTLLADIEKDKVILNKGKIHGYCKELQLSIEGKGESVEDPATGRIIHIKTKKLGDIKLTEVDSQFSIGIITNKNNEFNKVKVENLLVKPTNPKSCLKKFSGDKPNTSYPIEGQGVNNVQ